MILSNFLLFGPSIRLKIVPSIQEVLWFWCISICKITYLRNFSFYSLQSPKLNLWFFVGRLVWVIFLLNFCISFATFQKSQILQKRPCQSGIKKDLLCNHGFGFLHQNHNFKLHMCGEKAVWKLFLPLLNNSDSPNLQKKCLSFWPMEFTWLSKFFLKNYLLDLFNQRLKRKIRNRFIEIEEALFDLRPGIQILAVPMIQNFRSQWLISIFKLKFLIS